MSIKVFTVGVFDYFHYGHLKLFERAKNFGDYLIVAVQDSGYILKYKPEANIFYTTEQRIELVKSLSVVNNAIIYYDVDKIIQEVDFDIFVVGEDQRHDGFMRSIDWCKANNKKVVILTRTPGVSSSDIKEKIR